MTYSQTSTLAVDTLAEPTGDDRVATSDIAYFTARNRRKIYSAVIKEFKSSGITQTQLAKRLGKRPDVICRWLSGPGNWGVDTVSALLFGISGGELSYSVVHPLRQLPRNYQAPEWLDKPPPDNHQTGEIVDVDVSDPQRAIPPSGTDHPAVKYSVLADA
ncbi:MAG: helix-turn-helix transcriptional regulator [Roseiarcus sp.]